MKLIIDRKEWYRGEGIEESKLLRTDGRRCCIGILGRAVGIPDHLLLSIGGVGSTTHHQEAANKWPAWCQSDGGDIRCAYGLNDRLDLSEKERERQLTELFARNDIEVEFIN